MVDVFISYSRADEAAVRRLAQKIEAEGYEVWWDAELPPHKSYGEVIQEKVAACKAAIVVWSQTAGQSEWVRAEADLARNSKKLIQTALGDIMPPLPFNQIQFADIGDWQGEDDHSGWRKVKASLAELCGPREPSAVAGAGGSAIPATPPPQQPAPPNPAATPVAPQSAMTPPPGSLEAHRSSSSNAPLFIGLGVGALGLLGGAVFLAASLEDDFEDEPINPVAFADPIESGEAAPDLAPEEPTASPSAAQPVPTTSASYPTGPQSFSGSLNVGQSQSYSVGLDAGTSYMIVGNCDLDCSDIDMWLYDENGNLIDSDVLDDDVPVLEVTPVRSAEFQMRIEMFTCTVEPCGVQISVTPM
ncbi:MAG: toll/interleukin-1 receptor domain-containing protein [Erythrobacter sp.]